MYSGNNQAGLPSSFFTAKAPISTGSNLLPSTFHQSADYVRSTMTSLYEYNSSSLRTVYLGNLPHDVTPKDICDLISVGVIESIKLVHDKNCAFVTFLEGEIADFFLKQVAHRPLEIGGREIKVGWGKKSLLSETLWQAVKNGASRNIVLANVCNMTHEWLESIFSVFGTIESIMTYPEEDTASIHLTSITAAIKAVVTLSMDSRWAQTRISYGRDRCAPPAASTSLLTLPKSLEKSLQSSLLYKSEPLVDQRGTSAPLMGNRTVYLGGIHPEAITKDLCDVTFYSLTIQAIRGGILQNIKYLSDKNIAFITFIEASAALSFYNRGMTDGLSLKGKRVKFGWGKATPLPHTVASAVLHLGASRNVYIGSLDDSITEEILAEDFKEFGEIELVNLVPEKNIGFVNFTDIMSAVKAVELMRHQFQVEGVITVGGRDYSKYKINFGKDRCGNPPRPPRTYVSTAQAAEIFERKLTPAGDTSPLHLLSAYSSFYDSPSSSSSSGSLNLRRVTPPISPVSVTDDSTHHHLIMSSLGLEDPDMDFNLHHFNKEY